MLASLYGILRRPSPLTGFPATGPVRDIESSMRWLLLLPIHRFLLHCTGLNLHTLAEGATSSPSYAPTFDCTSGYVRLPVIPSAASLYSTGGVPVWRLLRWLQCRHHA